MVIITSVIRIVIIIIIVVPVIVVKRIVAIIAALNATAQNTKILQPGTLQLQTEG